MTLKVTVKDLQTGDVDEALVEMNDYLLLCHGRCHLAEAKRENRGETHILTIKGRKRDRPLKKTTS